VTGDQAPPQPTSGDRPRGRVLRPDSPTRPTVSHDLQTWVEPVVAGTLHPTAPEPAPLGVLSNRRFLALWLAQLFTQVGGNTVIYGLTILIYGLTSSNAAVSLLILTFLAPAVAFGAVAGVYVDRFDRRLILIWTNVLRGAAFLLMIVGSREPVLIYLLNAFVSTATTFFGPAEAAMIPALVDRRHLLQATGLFNVTMNASFALGFALLGPLAVNLAGPNALLLIVAISYLVAAAFCVTLPSDAPDEALREEHALGGAERAIVATGRQLREGLAFIRSNPRIYWSLTYLAITASLIGVLGVLGPDFATKALGLRETDFVVVILPLGAGIVIGILVLNVYGRFMPRRRVIEGGLLGLAFTLLVLSMAGPLSRFLQARTGPNAPIDFGPIVSLLSIVVLLALCAGLAYAFVAISAQTQLQEELPEEVRGRVFGVLNMLVSVASFLPIVVVGPVADVAGTPAVIAGWAVIIGLAGLGSIIAVHPPYPVSAVPAGRLEPTDAGDRGPLGS
jgi:MFS family permease